MSNTVITWKDIKLAALQKMFSANGTTIQFDSSNSEYLYAMPNTANEGLQMLATAGKFLLGEYTIVNRPINPLNGSFENVQIPEGEYRFSIDGAKSYYFRCEGVCTVNIVVGDTTFKTIDVQSKEKYATYKGNINDSSLTHSNNPNDIDCQRGILSPKPPIRIVMVALYSSLVNQYSIP